MPRIPALTPASSVAASDMVPIESAGVTTKRATAEQIANNASAIKGVSFETTDSLAAGQVWRKRGSKLRALKPIAGHWDVLDYGLVADGTTPNDTAMDALRTLVEATGTLSGVIYFPAGTYRFNASIERFPINVTFRGESLAGTILNFYGAGVCIEANSLQDFECMTINGCAGVGARTAQIIGATNATPIEIETAAAHGYTNGDLVDVYGVLGNTAANTDATPRAITVTSPTKFTMAGSVGNGAFAAVSKTIATASNETPVKVTTTTAHGLTSDYSYVRVSGVVGSATANGSWRIRVVDSTSFTLNGSVAGGAGVGGTVSFGGCAVNETGVNLIGINIEGNSTKYAAGCVDVHVRQIQFGGSKFGVSVDGGEVISIEKCIFGTSTAPGPYPDLATDNGNHSAMGIRIGSFNSLVPQNANVVHVDECAFYGTMHAVFHQNGILHTVTRCIYEQAVMAIVSGGCMDVTYRENENDGSHRDLFVFRSDAAASQASQTLNIRDNFLSGTASIVDLSGANGGFAVALAGLTMSGGVWAGVAIPIKAGSGLSDPVSIAGLYAYNVPVGTGLVDGVGVYAPNGPYQTGTPINHYGVPAAGLDVAYVPPNGAADDFPAHRVAHSGRIFHDRKWKTTNYPYLGGTCEAFDDVLSTATGTMGARDGKGLGHKVLAAAAGASTLGATDVPASEACGTITMRVSAHTAGGTGSWWTVVQKYSIVAGVPTLAAAPDSIESDDQIGSLTTPTMSFSGAYPNNQIVANVTAHAALNCEFAAKFTVDAVGA